MPGQVAAALESTVIRIMRSIGELRAHACAVRDTRASGARGVLRTFKGLLIVVIARPAGQRQDLRDQVVVDRCEERRLLVAALEVLTERDIVVALGGSDRRVPGSRNHVAHTCLGFCRVEQEVRRSTGRDRLVQEVHVVLDVEVFPERTDEAPHPPIVGCAEPQLMALVRGFDMVQPGRIRRVAGERSHSLADEGAAAGAGVVEPARRARVVRVIHRIVDRAAQVTARINQLEVANLAVDGPRRVLPLVLVVGRRE